MTNSCPLCSGSQLESYHSDKQREYWQCLACELVFVPSNFHLSNELERAEYEKHQNSPSDTNYRKFLSRLQKPLVERLNTRAIGLDFGCGPGPTLSKMFIEQGYTMDIFDIYFYPNNRVFDNKYQFICMSEVIEHISKPAQIISQLTKLLENKGWLGIMTKRVTGIDSFAEWHYKNDPTHICFYSESTFQWIAKQWNLHMTVVGADVVILQKI